MTMVLALFSSSTVLVPFHPNRKPLDKKHIFTLLKPEHDILAMSNSAYLVLDSKQLPNYRRLSTTYYFKNPFWWHTKVRILMKV